MTTATNKKQATEWTEERYRKQRKDIQAVFDRKIRETEGYLDRNLAAMFNECGWTQERIAEAEGKSVAWVCCHLRLGRFLGYFFTRGKKETRITGTFSEKKFRRLWEHTAKSLNEPARFERVAEMMDQGIDFRPTNAAVKSKIVDLFANDRKWHTTEEIVERTGVSRDQMLTALGRIYYDGNGNKGDIEVQRQEYGPNHGHRWRIRKSTKAVMLPPAKIALRCETLRDRAKDIFKLAEGHPALTSNTAIRQNAVLIERLVDEIEGL